MKKTFLLILIILACGYIVGSVYGADDGLVLMTKSKYFSIYSTKEFDVHAFLDKRSFQYFLQPDVALQQRSTDEKAILASVIDAIYLEISDILDIHVYSFQGQIKIVPDRRAVVALFKKYFSVDFNERSFYIPEQNTLYISNSDLTLGMLGHEIAHAIMASYFVVPTPTKMQEILAGYVEFKLRKLTAGNSASKITIER